MKRTVGALLLTLGVLGATYGLDTQKLVTLETTLAPVMENTDQASLRALDAQLASLTDPLSQVKAGIVRHNLSRAIGDETHRGNAQAAIDHLKGPARGADAELAALSLPYLGSATTLKAREDGNPVGKMLAVKDGWAVLGEAVDKYGEATFVPRMIRVWVAASLPDFFGKDGDLLKDAAALEVWDKAHPGRMGDGVKAQMALLQGNAFKKQKDLAKATEAWKRALALDPAKKGPGKAAAEALDRYGD